MLGGCCWFQVSSDKACSTIYSIRIIAVAAEPYVQLLPF